jgi:PASTA domain
MSKFDERGQARLPKTHRCAGRSFYVNYQGGNDSSRGRSRATAWKRAPGMRGFGGMYAHQGHDCFYFKGGVTWPNAVFPLRISGGGNPSANTYLGPDKAWHAGAAWSRPVFDAQGMPISVGRNSYIITVGDYVTVDNIEFTGWRQNAATGYGTCSMIDFTDNTHELVDHIYVHGLVNHVEASDTECMVVKAKTYGDEGGADTIQNSVFAGDPNSYMEVGRGINYWHSNVIHDFIGMMFPGGGHNGEIDGNLAYNCGYPHFPANSHGGHHADLLQSNPSETKAFSLYIHDNVFHGTGADRDDECELALLGNPGESDYLWNNVVWDVQGNGFGYPQAGRIGSAYYAWNNTIDASISATDTFCFRGSGRPATVSVQNNYCISKSGFSHGLSAANLRVDHNVRHTGRQAAAAGYRSRQAPYAYAPPGRRSATVDAGIDLSALCNGAISGLCRDTTYGATETAAHQVRVVIRPALARPQGAAWDVGAYEWRQATRCVVPHVIGNVVRTARRRIVRAHCRVGKIIRKTSPQRLRGRVLSQRPRPGRKVRSGARVNLTVGAGE